MICAATALTVSGCASTSPTGTTAQMCEDWRTVNVRKIDRINSDDTAREIIGNNEARRAWCSADKKA